MIELFREEIKADEVYNQLLAAILSNHKVTNHTENVLLKNKHIKDFCECSRHFIMINSDKPLFIHYDVNSWFKHPNGVQLRIESIGIYDDFMEYESARLKGLHGSEKADIPNIN